MLSFDLRLFPFFPLFHFGAPDHRHFCSVCVPYLAETRLDWLKFY